jgi:hypothetical protein
MNINVLNDYPIFTVPITDQTVSVGQISNYLLSNNDPEGFTNTLTLLSALPSYVTFSSSLVTLHFTPTYSVAATTIPISLSLFDGAMTTLNTFNLIIVNNPPVFTSALLD